MYATTSASDASHAARSAPPRPGASSSITLTRGSRAAIARAIAAVSSSDPFSAMTIRQAPEARLAPWPWPEGSVSLISGRLGLEPRDERVMLASSVAASLWTGTTMSITRPTAR